MKDGWTMEDVDNMDIHFFFEVMELGEDSEKEQEGFIDQVW
jgi:hypothetical protein